MIWCIKTYIIADVKTHTKRYIINYVKPTAQLLFKIHDTKRRKDNQLQSLKLPCRISKLSSETRHKWVR